jgi:hypothetical protein
MLESIPEHFQPFHIFHKIVMRSLRVYFLEAVWILVSFAFLLLLLAAAACALFSAADLFASSAFF